ACGSLGQGLSAAAGFALADRLRGHPEVRTFAFLSDGELEEGQVWEAAMFAGHYRLGRLTVLLDANNSQVDGPVDTITTIEPVAGRRRPLHQAARRSRGGGGSRAQRGAVSTMSDDARTRPGLESPVLEPPYRTVLKPYGHALVELARQRPEIVCLSGDLTRQC